MIWFTIIIPILAAVVLLVFFQRKTKWWEALILIAVSALTVLLFNAIFVGYRTATSEYWGGYITEVYHSEHWNEWIVQTCTREYPCGTDSKGNTQYCTETYDCSYCEDHPEYWEMYGNNGESITISQSYYQRLLKQFGTKENFINKHRDFYTIDGNAYNCYFNGDKNRAEVISSTHTYENRIKVSNSILRVDKPDTSIVRLYGLYNYPKIVDWNQQMVLGYKGKDSASIERQFQIINGMLGRQKQVRVFLIVFYDKPIEAGIQQKAYWEGGNKNEFVVTIGLNRHYNDVDWCYAFSWAEKPILEQEAQTCVMNMKWNLDLSKLSSFLYEKIPTDWHKRDFHQFDYLVVQPSGGQLWAMWIIMILLNVGVAYWILTNEYENDDEDEVSIGDASSIVRDRLKTLKLKRIFIK